MNLSRLPANAPIARKIAWARQWWDQNRERLRFEEKLLRTADRLREAAQRSRRIMVETGMVEICRRCGEKGDSCCGAGLERRYTDILLLINLSLGVQLPDRRMDPRSCFFLGENGCLLTARQVLCINYLCSELSAQLDPTRLAALRKLEGEEIALLFELNEGFLRLLNPGQEGKERR